MGVGESMPFSHSRRKNEEVYIILSGEGEFRINGKRVPVGAGSVIRIVPGVVRTWRNTSPNEELRFVTIRAEAVSPEASENRNVHRS